MASKIIAYRLRNTRKLYRLSQQGAARLLGVTPTQLMEWERGKRMPSDRYLRRLSALYKTLSDALYPELRQEAVAEIEKNVQKYGPDGLGISKERPP